MARAHFVSSNSTTVRPAMEPVDAKLIEKLTSMTQALQLCQTLSGLESHEFIGPLGVVSGQAQWSRIMNAGQHNFPQDGLNFFMDLAGNEVPLLWLLHSRGYALDSLKQRETEMERKLRLAQEENARLRLDVRALTAALRNGGGI
ncbi:hypothetical protein ACQ858_08310 [Variovorax ureilyticus]|uniref:hypothetical protein n=1 Tax=Variovorax ureilyticus TaxID=1836198 RepID=UPI003D668766